MRKLLFFDDWLLDRRSGFDRVLHQPELAAESVLGVPGKTEGGGYLTAIYDEERKIYRLWFNDFTVPEAGPQKLFMRYAESGDGIHWEVGNTRHAMDGWSDLAPGIVFSGEHKLSEALVWHDPADTDPERRFKMPHIVAERYYPTPVIESRWAFSKDGIQWRVERGHPWSDRISDTANCLLRNPFTGRIQMTMRKEWGDRRVAIMDTEDLITWSRPRTVVHPDCLDPECVHFYGMPHFLYEGYFVGFLWLMHTVSDEMQEGKNAGTVDCQLAYSYDGLAWNRGPRQPFIARRSPGTYGSGCLYPSSLVPAPDGSLRIFSAGTRWGHEGPLKREDAVKAPGTAILSYRLRSDGFVGLRAGSARGHLVTKRMKLNAPELFLNVSAASGRVQVRISDAESKPFPGYDFKDCVPFTGDDAGWRPRWRTHDDLSDVMDSKDGVRVEVMAEQAELFAVKMECGLCLTGGVIQDSL